jgi:uncharacterized protein (TIGR03085 family)
MITPTILRMTGYARDERRSFAETLLAAGPDAPTLCEGWTTRDLAAHVVVRERRPLAAAAHVVPRLHPHAERVRLALAARPYEQIVARLRRPPWWSPVSNPVTNELLNRVEMFVHHEDVRRGGPGWEPRELPDDYRASLFESARAVGRLSLRRFDATVALVTPGLREAAVGPGSPAATLTGEPGELLMFLTGRQRAARVVVDGDPALAERLRRARLGV